MTYLTLVRQLQKVLRAVVEASVDTGVADDTSIVSRLDDSAKSWPVNAFTNLIVEITGGTGEGQIRKIASNTATSLVPVTNFDTAPDSTSTYRIGFFGKMASDITAWGGTALTGRDITTDIQKLTTGIEIADRAARLLGVVYGSRAQQLLQRATTFDLLIQLRHAGVEIDPRAIRALTSSDVVDLSDKWVRQLGLVDISRVLGTALSATNPVIVRLTDGSAVQVSPIKAQLPAALTAAGNLKLSIEEAAIATPADIQARYNVKSTRDVAVPDNDASYWLPETDSIDLSNFLHSTWFIKKATNKPAAVELHISLDDGSTFAKAEGFEITTTDFVLDTWNTIDCPMMLAQAKLLVTAGATGAGALNMAVIRKA